MLVRKVYIDWGKLLLLLGRYKEVQVLANSVNKHVKFLKSRCVCVTCANCTQSYSISKPRTVKMHSCIIIGIIPPLLPSVKPKNIEM